MIAAHLPLIEEAGRKRVQVLCLQEVFTQPYFCPSQDAKWYAAVERIPEGPTVRLMQELARKHSMVIVVPIYEEEITGIYYNTAAVIDADGRYLGKYRKSHIPQVAGFWEKFFFKPGNLGYPTFQTAYCRLGVYICYDRHFPEGWRALALNGAEYIVNFGNRVGSVNTWGVEQLRLGRGQRLLYRRGQSRGTEAALNIRFYGSPICQPARQDHRQGSEDKDEP
jgi:N-carbamoylputrescine amidase